ncbi:MAG: type II toxin-antitoxin system VapC family toxin [bacterium]
MIVIDASVALKWFLQEKDSDRALRIREEHLSGLRGLNAPDLILSEVSNVLRFSPHYNSQATKSALVSLLDIDINVVVLSRGIYELAIELAYRYEITVYDAIYVALAQDLGYDFITADEKLYQKVKGLRFVKLLSKI